MSVGPWGDGNDEDFVSNLWEFSASWTTDL